MSKQIDGATRNWKFPVAGGGEGVLKAIDEKVAKRVLSVVDKGLSNGLGKPVPGKMCVEAAVCYAIGQSHDDNPVCVANEIRELKIEMNDQLWVANSKERARALRRISIAQLGTTDPKFNSSVFWDEYRTRVAALINGVIEANKPKLAAPDIKTLEALVQKLKSANSPEAVDDLCGSISREADSINEDYDPGVDMSEVEANIEEFRGCDGTELDSLLNAGDEFLTSMDVPEKKRTAALRTLSFQIAEAGVQALKKAGAPGAKYLYLAKEVPTK